MPRLTFLFVFLSAKEKHPLLQPRRLPQIRRPNSALRLIKRVTRFCFHDLV